MFKVIEELMNRFIEFILQFVSGTNAEERLTSALRTCIISATVLFWLVVSLLVSTVLQKVEIANLQAGIKKVNILFDSSSNDSPFSEFIKLNNSLVERLELSTQEKEYLIRQNVKLMSLNEFLTSQRKQDTDELNQLKVEVGICRRGEDYSSGKSHSRNSRSTPK